MGRNGKPSSKIIIVGVLVAILIFCVLFVGIDME
jgi:hypothetical protein